MKITRSFGTGYFYNWLAFLIDVCYNGNIKAVDMKNSEIKKLDKFTVENPQMKRIRLSVYLVYRGNFNDERLIESKELSVEELTGKPLLWLDVYLGKHNASLVKLAFVYLKNRDLYFLQDDGKNVKLIKKTGFSYIYSDDYDENYIISTHIW